MSLSTTRLLTRLLTRWPRPVPTHGLLPGSAGRGPAPTRAGGSLSAPALAAALVALPIAPALAPAFAADPGLRPPEVTLSALPYPGAISLRVDTSDLDHKLFRVRESLPVKAGPLRLVYPRWLPGNHSPTGEVGRVAGLEFKAGGQPVAWTRDPYDVDAFVLDVPAGASRLDIEFQYLSPTGRDSGRLVVTPEMLNLQWNAVVLYPAGFRASQITVEPSLRLPAGWTLASALRLRSSVANAGAAGADADQGELAFQPVTLEMLVDSPIFAGRFVRKIELDPPGTPRPVVLNLVADRADLLNPTEPQIEAHRELVRQADKVFGARHYAHYDFLLAISDQLGGIGLEHHQSSENGVKTTYWEDWDKRIGARELLPHEYTHSWNGKFRRPEDLSTPNYNVPMGDTLLWVYEGQTQFWGWVLAARSGLSSPDLARERLADTAASAEHRLGRAWRNLQDTTNDPTLALHLNKDWPNWQRTRGDYYEEALLIWLDADSLIRQKSGGTRSIDDFARAFFGIDDGQTGPKTYRFDDVVQALNRVQPNDWAAFLRQRLDGHASQAPLDGLARSGWRLVYTDKPSAAFKAREAENKVTDLSDGIGLVLGKDDKIIGVDWGSPAFAAGLAPSLTLVAVNQRAYKSEVLTRAITANLKGEAPIELLVRDGDLYRSVRIDYRGGLRYPQLERVPDTEDRLAPLLARH